MQKSGANSCLQAILQTLKYSGYSESMNDDIEDCSKDDSTTVTENTEEKTATEDENGDINQP